MRKEVLEILTLTRHVEVKSGRVTYLINDRTGTGMNSEGDKHYLELRSIGSFGEPRSPTP